MSIDLVALNAADPGGTVESAYATLSAEALPATYGTLTGNDLRIWAAGNPTSYTQLKEAAATSVAAEMAHMLVTSPDSILELGKPEVMGLVDDLTSANFIEASGTAALLEAAEINTLKWPRLKIGQIITARRQLTIADSDPRTGVEPVSVAEPQEGAPEYDAKKASYDAYKLLFDTYIETVAGDVATIKGVHNYPNLSVSELRNIRKLRDQGRI